MMAPSFSWIDAQLAVGGRVGAPAWPSLRADHGIDCVVDLRSEEQDDPGVLKGHGIELLLLPTEDHRAVSGHALASGVAWIEQRCREGRKVLVHCEHGIGRSVLLVWCVLVARGVAASAALERIKAARRIASPSPEQIHALLAYARAYSHELPSWGELAELAYAHLRDAP